MSARVIAIANQKGGVGKTTTAVNLSAALAQKGKKVLVIDIDPQGNATSGLGIDKFDVDGSMYDVFTAVFNLTTILLGTEMPSLWIAPAHADLVGAELELADKPGRELVLRKEIESVTAQFDYIFIDCPPSVSLLTVNAFASCHSILVPLQCEYYALEGISSLMQTVEMARKQLNTALEIEGVVLTMYDGRTNLSRQIVHEAREFFGDRLYQTIIPRNVRLSECPSHGKPIFLYDPGSLGAGAYQALADELLKRRRLATESTINSAAVHKIAV